MSAIQQHAKDFEQQLWDLIESRDCPEQINLLPQFREFLSAQLGVPRASAEELALQKLEGIKERLARRCTDWEGCGIPRPIADTDLPHTFLTWRHTRFHELTGYPALPTKFAEISHWMNNLNEREFLLPCAYYLKLIGASRIFVTDGSHDQGIDLIAKVGKGGLRSTAIFVQVKKTGDYISKDMLLAEYGKFLALPHSRRYRSYRDALNIDSSTDGVSYCYLFVSNRGFNFPAREIARNLGILLRIRIQLAHELATVLDLSALEEIQKRVGRELPTDLTSNLADSLCLVRTRR